MNDFVSESLARDLGCMVKLAIIAVLALGAVLFYVGYRVGIHVEHQRHAASVPQAEAEGGT